MRRHFKKFVVILNYNKWDSTISNILSYQDNLFASCMKGEFDFKFHLSNGIKTKHDIVISFNDIIEDIKNKIDQNFRNQFYYLCDCKRNLLIFFNQPDFDRWEQEEELELLLNNLRDEHFTNGSCRTAFINLMIFLPLTDQ
jgi:hypothetical protein